MLNPNLIAYITDNEPKEGTELHYDSNSNQDVKVTWSPLPDGCVGRHGINPMKALAASLNTFSKIVENTKEETSFASDYRIVINTRDLRKPPIYDKCWRVEITIAPHKEPKKDKPTAPSVEKKAPKK